MIYKCNQRVRAQNEIILMPCSGRKIQTGTSTQLLSFLQFDAVRQKIVTLYTDPNKKHQRKTNKGVIRITSNTLNPNVCTSAKDRYTGLMYKQISAPSWLRGKDNVLILSALFGFIKPDDQIPWYDLSMNDTINDIKISTIWKKSGVLNQFINQNQIAGLDFVAAGFSSYSNSFAKFASLGIDMVVGNDRGTEVGSWIDNNL